MAAALEAEGSCTAQLDLTMIYVTHDQTEALTFADKVVVMHDGAVVQIGTPEELFERPAHTFVGYFIGSPGMNVAAGRRSTGATARIDGHAIALRSQLRRAAVRRQDRARHPARIRRRRAAGAGLLPATIERIDDLGRIRFARVARRRCQVRGKRAAGIRRSPATRPGSVFDPAHVHVYADGRLRRGGCLMDKTDQPEGLVPGAAGVRCWWPSRPILPLMTVVNYSVQDTFGNNQFFWNGIGWFQELLDPSTELGERFLASLWRNLLFSAIILAIEIPLGIVVALAMPREGWTRRRLPGHDGAAAADPVERGRHHLADLRRGPTSACSATTLNSLGIDYNYIANPLDAWITVIVMDVWHWTSWSRCSAMPA